MRRPTNRRRLRERGARDALVGRLALLRGDWRFSDARGRGARERVREERGLRFERGLDALEPREQFVERRCHGWHLRSVSVLTPKGLYPKARGALRDPGL